LNNKFEVPDDGFMGRGFERKVWNNVRNENTQSPCCVIIGLVEWIWTMLFHYCFLGSKRCETKTEYVKEDDCSVLWIRGLDIGLAVYVELVSIVVDEERLDVVE